MDNNLILLLLNKKEEEKLKNSRNAKIAQLASKNYGIVSTEDAYNAKIYLSGPSRHKRQIDYTEEQLVALEMEGNDYYLYLNGKTVGDDLYYEVQDHLKELLVSQRAPQDDGYNDEEQLEY